MNDVTFHCTSKKHKMAEKAITGTRSVTECIGFGDDKVQKVKAILCVA